MNSLDYVELTCQVEPLQPWSDIFISELAEAGFESFEETPQGFKAYIQATDFNQDILEGIFGLESYPEKPILKTSIKHIDGKNWNEVWESNFEPVLVGNSLYIRAPFHPSIETAELEVIIEPKMSFGTGHHETTSLMSEWLLEIDFKEKAVLDMGCGTGILAILAAMKGAERVVAIDNYIYAYENTIENAQRNNVPSIIVHHGDAELLGGETFDIIIANITRNVLLQDMDTYVDVLNDGGTILFSGFLEKDRGYITSKATSLGLKFVGEKKNKDWLALNFKKG
jgi:ribosomal protein L11 methyltransferase